MSDQLEKHQITGRFPHNLKTLEVLLLRNAEDYRVALSRSATKAQRPRRVERPDSPSLPGRSTGRRTGPADGAFRRDLSAVRTCGQARGRTVRSCWRRRLTRRTPSWTRHRRELRRLLRMTQHTQRRTAEALGESARGIGQLPGGQEGTFARQPAAGRLDRQEVPQPGRQLPRSDPGRQRRLDAGGREI